jgi:hypothetical protein
MNQEMRNLLHDLRGQLDQVNTCFSCIVFDLKDKKEPSNTDMEDLEKSLDSFRDHFEKFNKLRGKK